jgi:hypothetical protein
VRAAVDDRKPVGWRRSVQFLKEWGVLGSVLTIVVALIGLLVTAIIALVHVSRLHTREDAAHMQKDAGHVEAEAVFRATTNAVLEQVRAELRVDIGERVVDGLGASGASPGVVISSSRTSACSAAASMS